MLTRKRNMPIGDFSTFNCLIGHKHPPPRMAMFWPPSRKVVHLNDYFMHVTTKMVFFDDCAMILIWIALSLSLEDDILN